MLVSWNLLASDSAKRLSGRSTEGHEVWRNLYYFGNLQAKEIGTMDSKPAQNIQDTFLNTARKDKSPITIYLVSGVKLTGRIRSFDKYSVLLENNGQEQLIFKHAISAVLSGRPALQGEGRVTGEHRPGPTSATAEGQASAPAPIAVAR